MSASQFDASLSSDYTIFAFCTFHINHSTRRKLYANFLKVLWQIDLTTYQNMPEISWSDFVDRSHQAIYADGENSERLVTELQRYLVVFGNYRAIMVSVEQSIKRKVEEMINLAVWKVFSFLFFIFEHGKLQIFKSSPNRHWLNFDSKCIQTTKSTLIIIFNIF